MTPIAYFDFDLVIETFGNGYRANVIDSPAGQAPHAFRFPADDWELETFLVWLGSARYTDTPIQVVDLLPQLGEFTLSQTWIHDSPLAGCVVYYTQLEYQTDSVRIAFRDTNSNVAAQTFQVCAPER